MAAVALQTKDGTAFSLDMPDRAQAGDAPAGGAGGHTFVLSAAKCGSSLFYSMLIDYFTGVGRVFASVPDQLHRLGIMKPQVTDGLYAEIDARPGIYLGFRTFFDIDRCAAFAASPKFVLVRDPRDALVSHYFSVRGSHSVPKSGAAKDILLKERELAAGSDIEDYITQVRGGHFIAVALRQLANLDPERTTFYRYEDVIFDKRRWMEHLLTAMGLAPIDAARLDAIVAAHDVVPDSEDPSRHIRQVHPGNYRRRLGETAIRWIEREYADILLSLGYPLDFPAEADRGGAKPAGLLARRKVAAVAL